jgi:pyruvate carboxylase
MYAAANDILGNIVKVTPSSKVVGDLALHLVGAGVDPADFAQAPDKYDVPDSVIGFLSGELREGSPAFEPKTWAAIEDVYVAPGHRSLGIGRALFEECRKWAKEKRAHGISLQAAAGNARARRFYKELGFREVSVYEVKEL